MAAMPLKQPRAEADPGAPERVLVIHTAFIGDLVIASAFLKNLRALLPEAKISFLSTPAGCELLSPNPWNLELIPFAKRGKDAGPLGLARMVKLLREKHFDRVFCLHRSARSVVLAKGVGAPVFGFEEAVGSFLFRGRIPRKAFIYEAEKNNALLSFLNPHFLPDPYPELFVDDAAVDAAKDLTDGIGPYAVYAPSSVWATKRWPAERFGELAARIHEEYGLRAVVLGAKDGDDPALAACMVESYRKYARGSSRGAEPVNLAGRTTLSTLKAVVKGAEFAVSNDSAPMHFAVAFRVPILGIFGPTTRSLGFFPNAPEGMSAVAEREGLACRPCGLHGHRKCPESHFKCMLELEVDSVFEKAKGLLCISKP